MINESGENVSSHPIALQVENDWFEYAGYLYRYSMFNTSVFSRVGNFPFLRLTVHFAMHMHEASRTH